MDQDLCIGCSHCVEVCPQATVLVDEKSEVTDRANARPATARGHRHLPCSSDQLERAAFLLE